MKRCSSAMRSTPYYPLFMEDPVTPDNLDEMAYVADKISIPIATGERMTSVWEFQMLLARNAVQMVRPDICIVGGISGARKVAALAEASHVGVVPHNPLSCRLDRRVPADRRNVADLRAAGIPERYLGRHRQAA